MSVSLHHTWIRATCELCLSPKSLGVRLYDPNDHNILADVCDDCIATRYCTMRNTSYWGDSYSRDSLFHGEIWISWAETGALSRFQDWKGFNLRHLGIEDPEADMFCSLADIATASV